MFPLEGMDDGVTLDHWQPSEDESDTEGKIDEKSFTVK